MDVIHRVGGMTCGGCVASVTKALERAGATGVVDLAAGTVTVPDRYPVEAVRRAIEAAGFDHLGAAPARSPE